MPPRLHHHLQALIVNVRERRAFEAARIENQPPISMSYILPWLFWH